MTEDKRRLGIRVKSMFYLFYSSSLVFEAASIEKFGCVPGKKSPLRTCDNIWERSKEQYFDGRKAPIYKRRG
jgi:hypothetical protein